MAEYKEKKIISSPDAVLLKMQSWCAYQERSQHEVRTKLRSYQMRDQDTEQIIAELISLGFVNEQRFATAFARGKFRIKHWGRIKIRQELKMHRIPETIINTAIQELEEQEYLAVLKKEIEKKINTTKASQKEKLFYSVLRYLQTRGFESELIRDVYYSLEKE